MSRYAFMFPGFMVFLAVLSLQAYAASAANINYYGIESEVETNFLVNTDVTLILDGPISSLNYDLDFEIMNLTIETDSGASRCELKNVAGSGQISCSFFGMDEGENTIEMRFSTKDAITRNGDRYEFSTTFPVSMPISRMFSTIKLPPKGLLVGEVVNQSYFPPTARVLTDGKRIILSWERRDIAPNDTLSFSVIFEMVGEGGVMWDLTVVSMTAAVVLVMIIVAIYMRRGSSGDAKTEVKVLPLLNKDEKMVVDIVAKHEGEVRQRDIVRESDFSKAKVSRLIKNLKERGVIDTEAISGRENKVILKIKGVGE